jgi:hypothetical protein
MEWRIDAKAILCLMGLHDFEAKLRTEDRFVQEWGNWKEIRSRADGDYFENSA